MQVTCSHSSRSILRWGSGQESHQNWLLKINYNSYACELQCTINCGTIACQCQKHHKYNGYFSVSCYFQRSNLICAILWKFGPWIYACAIIHQSLHEAAQITHLRASLPFRRGGKCLTVLTLWLGIVIFLWWQFQYRLQDNFFFFFTPDVLKPIGTTNHSTEPLFCIHCWFRTGFPPNQVCCNPVLCTH